MLKEIIKANGLTGTSQEVFDRLRENVSIPITTAYNGGMLEEAIGIPALETVLAAIEASPLRVVRLAAVALGTKDGLTLHDKFELIDSLNISSQIKSQLKALGAETKTRYESLGGEGSITLQDVTQALFSIAIDARRSVLLDAAEDAIQAYREDLSSWDGVSPEPKLGG